MRNLDQIGQEITMSNNSTVDSTKHWNNHRKKHEKHNVTKGQMQVDQQKLTKYQSEKYKSKEKEKVD